MLYAVICEDRPGALAVRQSNRPEHRAYLDSTGVVVLAGPLLDDAGEMNGSLVVIDVPDRATAEAWAEGDPYARAGLFARVEVRAWNRVRG
jgi:uncharacterized protein